MSTINFMRYDDPIRAAQEVLQRANFLGANASLQFDYVASLSSHDEGYIIAHELAKMLAEELVKHTLIDRAIELVQPPGEAGDRITYNVELAVMTRADFLALRAALAQIQIERAIIGDHR